MGTTASADRGAGFTLPHTRSVNILIINASVFILHTVAVRMGNAPPVSNCSDVLFKNPLGGKLSNQRVFYRQKTAA